ncbi:ferredoxin oxidoreductase [Patescibacteria group bacterium]
MMDKTMDKKFMMGNKVLAMAAKDAGAKLMFGYPITPASEILETWVKLCQEDKKIDFMQTEDEMSAGFSTIGACLAGTPTFTATAGPGNVLMQDAFSMAEALRIPTVAMIVQRGGLSTSTVIYSQEEVRLTCFGGNGEGFRIVYSTAGLQDLYDLTIKAFEVAWKYRYPTFILADGYQGKTKGLVSLNKPKVKKSLFKPILKKGVNLRNCYNLEEEIGRVILDYYQDFEKIRPEIEESEAYEMADAQVMLLAHGIVGAAVKEAVRILRKKGLKVGLFRPITLRPFPSSQAKKYLKKVKKIIVFESALGQLAELFKNEFYHSGPLLLEVNKPAVGFTPEEIVKLTQKALS